MKFALNAIFLQFKISVSRNILSVSSATGILRVHPIGTTQMSDRAGRLLAGPNYVTSGHIAIGKGGRNQFSGYSGPFLKR